MKRLATVFLWFFILMNLLYCPNSLLAQEQAKVTAETAAVDAPPTHNNITVDFKDADIHDVLKILSYKSGVNIVASKDIQGTVSIRLADVPWEKALEVILKNNGFVYERDGDIIRVTTVENLSTEELSTEIFVLNYAKAKDVAESVKEMLSERGKIKFDERTNQLVVTDVPAILYKVKKVVERLDKRTAQILVETKIIETVLDKDERLGIDWTTYASAVGAARPTTLPFVFSSTGGITGKKFFPKVDTTTTDFSSSAANGFPYGVKSNFTFGTLNFTQLQAVMEIFKRRENTKTLSNPRLITLDNQKAEIGVTETLNIPTYEVDSTTGRLVVSGYTEKDVGIMLTVTPHVNPEGYIVVDLKPEVSSLQGWDSFSTGTGTINAPRISSRTTTTQVMIKNGETIIIGGLIRDVTDDINKKIPILGDIPILSYLFKKTTKTHDVTDLIIMVTVKLQEDLQAEPNQQAKADK